MKVRIAALATTLLVTGCSGEQNDAARREKAGAAYAESEEGRAAIYKAHSEAVLKRRVDGPASYMSRRYGWIEGNWDGAVDPASGSHMKASFSRDAISTLEIVAADGRTLQVSQGTMTLGKGRAEGRLHAYPAGLGPYSSWTAEPLADGTIMLKGKGSSQVLRRRV